MFSCSNCTWKKVFGFHCFNFILSSETCHFILHRIGITSLRHCNWTYTSLILPVATGTRSIYLCSAYQSWHLLFNSIFPRTLMKGNHLYFLGNLFCHDPRVSKSKLDSSWMRWNLNLSLDLFPEQGGGCASFLAIFFLVSNMLSRAMGQHWVLPLWILL